MTSGSGDNRMETSNEQPGNVSDDEEHIDLTDIEGNNMKYLKPVQDPSVRREIRQNYRRLMEGLERDKLDLINPESESDELNERLLQADELYKPVKMTREAALDSQALVMIANMGRQKAQALNTEFVKFQPVEFVEKLKTFLCGNVLEAGSISTEKWSSLGKAVQPFFKRSPPFRFMNGSFEKGEVQVRKERVRKVKEKDSGVDKVTIPIQVERVQDTDKMEATTAEVERIYKKLQKFYEISQNNPLCYFEFVTNPWSFGQTIENMFYVSFLVRDGLVRISLDEDKLPVIAPVKDGDKPPDIAERNQQVIVSMTPAEWKEMVKTFNITSCVIPNRKTTGK